MTLDEVNEILATSDAKVWEVIGGRGPSYLDQLIRSTGPGDAWELDVESHWARATYRPDVSLGLAWGLDYEGGRTWEDDWSAHFPDKVVRGQWADVLWAGSLIDRHLLLVVDGGRCKLPAPRPLIAPRTTPSAVEQFGNSVTGWQAAFARLINVLGGVDVEEYDRYLVQSGFVVVE